MKTATRLNSFLPEYQHDINQVFQKLHDIGIHYVDLNYPEHMTSITSEQMKALLDQHQLQANGIALRFRNEFLNGELGNADYTVSQKAMTLCKEAVDYCRVIGGEVITIWLGFDGFDYSFQIDYQKVWNQIKNCIAEIADYAPDLKISIEYKPYEERSYAFLDSIGTTMLMVKDIDRSNVGLTLDYCHMLMKHENPAFSACIAGMNDKLFGIHLNDGYGVIDDGLMVGTASIWKTLEFLYYIKTFNYDKAVYFDTFPKREDACEECIQNMKMTERLERMIDRVGMEHIKQVIEKNSGTQASQLMLDFLDC